MADLPSAQSNYPPGPGEFGPSETHIWSEERLAAVRQLIGWARGDHYCKRCNGTGELDYPQLDEPMECPDCGGEGEVLDG